MGERERIWSAFQADPEWQQGRAATEVNGPIVASVRNSFLRATPYSALQ
jgi:hypothetical protein